MNRRPPPLLLILLPGLVLVALGLVLFPSSGRDDSYISYWAATALSKFGAIVNYNGERVEQSSSLAQILVLAAAGKVVPVPLPTLAPVLSIVCGFLTVVMTYRMASRSAMPRALTVAWVVATSASLVYWSFGGLESSLAALLAAAMVLVCHRWFDRGRTLRSQLPVAILTTLAFVLVRPESMFVLTVALAGIGAAIVLGASDDDSGGEWPVMLRRFAWLSLLAAAIASATVAFRLIYFGTPFPQPVSAKAHGLSVDAIRNGIRYLWLQTQPQYTLITWAAGAVGVIAVLRTWFQRGRRLSIDLVAATFLGALVLFVVAAGGDWMEAGRFVVPALPMLALMAVHGVTAVVPVRFASAAFVALVVIQLAGVYHIAWERSYSMPLWRVVAVGREQSYPNLSFFEYANRLRERDAPVAERVGSIVSAIWSATGRPVTILTGQAGFIPYRVALAHYGRFRLIDRYGLVSRDFTQCAQSADIPRGPQGLALTYERFFREQSGWERCGAFSAPDVIVDVSRQMRRMLPTFRDHGYVFVFQQDRSVVESSKAIPGAPVYLDSFIAVRQDLAAIATAHGPAE